MLIAKPASRAAQAALDLVGDQQRVVLLRQLVCYFRKLLADWTDAAFPLHELKANAAHGGVELAFQVGNIIKFYELDARHYGCKWRAVFFLVRGGHCAKRAAVKGMFQCQN